jgi:hypothetical protein
MVVPTWSSIHSCRATRSRHLNQNVSLIIIGDTHELTIERHDLRHPGFGILPGLLLGVRVADGRTSNAGGHDYLHDIE